MPGITAPQRARTSRKPTGLPNPPMILLAGAEKTGKSRLAAEGTASELIGKTWWIEIGGSEGTADYYGRIPGANYEIVPHDGSYQDILDAVRWAVAQPPAVEGKRNMIVIDNVTVLWDMLSDEQALYARWRAEKNAQENRRKGPNPDLPVVVGHDLWNRAKDRWGEILWLLRRHTGPTLLLARQEVVTAFENDKPTRDKTRKIKTEKNLPAAVDAIVELHALGEAYLTGVRTLHWEVTPGQSERFHNFSIDALLRRMGFHEAAATRQVTESRPDAYLDEQREQEQGQRQEQQRGNQRQQPNQKQQPQPQTPTITGNQVVVLVHDALNDETDPEGRLRGIRETWGTRTLEQISTRTKLWGAMNADELITRALTAVLDRAKKKKRDQEDTTAGQTAQGAQQVQATGALPAPQDAAPERAREHQAHAETEPPAEYDSTPPPPDPRAEEPPPGESAEETSQAEEPQAPPATRPAPRRNRGEELAFAALHREAEVQARLLMLTKGEHLGPISETGDPELPVLRDYVQSYRPELIQTLEEAGETELAAYYRTAPAIDPKLAQRFAPYFESAPAGK
ncbi:hypothetical protein ACIBAC_00410 [Streptomyces sp. NPDC051362]|uniref:hypothetical protein n=1 Tax=Streptomyces sp. NPDC051362 TaxID=3365651 RepID=UPI0037AD7768